MNHSRALAKITAREIVAGSRKKWAQLHAAALEEIRMSDTRSTVSNLGGTANNETLPRHAGRAPAGDPLALEKQFGQGMAGSTSADSINSGMVVGSVVDVTIKPVDRKTIAGSTPGDHRAPGNKADLTAQFKDSPGPRDAARQFKNSRNDTGAPFQSTVDTNEVGD